VVAESVIMMRRGKNEEALKEETKVWRIDASLVLKASPRPHSPHVSNQELGSKPFALFRLRPKRCHMSPLGAQRSSLCKWSQALKAHKLCWAFQ